MPVMNTTPETTPETFKVTDQNNTELRMTKTADGFDVTVDPFVDYGSTVELTFRTKAELIAWLSA